MSQGTCLRERQCILGLCTKLEEMFLPTKPGGSCSGLAKPYEAAGKHTECVAEQEGCGRAEEGCSEHRLSISEEEPLTGEDREQ